MSEVFSHYKYLEFYKVIKCPNKYIHKIKKLIPKAFLRVQLFLS